jgi:arylsulfatase
MGWGDPGVYGGGHAIGAPTPNIDGLARDGLMLTSTYSQPSCSPTRATLMTGRLPPRHGIVFPPSVYQGGLPVDEITSAKILSESGYVTQLVGKWHLGEKTESQPQNLGYDDFFGFLGVCDQYTAWRDANLNPEFVYNPERTEILKKPPFNNYLVHAKKGKKLEKIKEITIPVLADIDQDFADYSDRFIRNMSKSDKPFYLIHSFSKVHSENYPAKGYKGKSPSK